MRSHPTASHPYNRDTPQVGKLALDLTSRWKKLVATTSTSPAPPAKSADPAAPAGAPAKKAPPPKPAAPIGLLPTQPLHPMIRTVLLRVGHDARGVRSAAGEKRTKVRELLEKAIHNKVGPAAASCCLLHPDALP